LLQEYEALGPCSASSAEFEARFWWLSDPLWSTPGNPRRSEHVVRNVQMMLEEGQGAVGPYAQDLWLASGLWNSWNLIEGDWRRVQAGEQPNRSARTYSDRYEFYVYGGYSFTPDESRFRDPARSTSQDWALRWDEGNERMHVPVEWHNLENYQIGMLRRGTGLLAVSAAGLPVIVSNLDSVHAALAMGRPDDLSVQVARAEIEPTGVLRASVALEDGEWLASIEAQGPGWTGRARFGAAAPPMVRGFGISSPLLVDSSFELAQLPLLQAISPTTAVPPNGQTGVYFEVYGARDGEPLEFSLQVERVDRSFLDRLASVFGRSASTGTSVSWAEPAGLSDLGVTPHYVNLDLSRLQPGAYRLRLAVRRNDGNEVTSERTITRR
jgi:hypothetical protein